MSDVGGDDDLCDALLGALAAPGGSAGNGRLGEVLQRDQASFDAVQAEHLRRGRVVPCRDRGALLS